MGSGTAQLQKELVDYTTSLFDQVLISLFLSLIIFLSLIKLHNLLFLSLIKNRGFSMINLLSFNYCKMRVTQNLYLKLLIFSLKILKDY